MGIKVESSYIRRKDMDSVLNCLVTDSIGPGEFLARFIRQAKESFGFEHAIALRTPIDALETAMRCLGVGRDGNAIREVAISALSPSYYLSAIKRCGLVPRVVDTEQGDCVPSGDSFAEAASRAGLAVVHEPYGRLPEFEPLRQCGVPIIEDMTMSLGAVAGDDRAGELGAYVFFSLEDGGLATAGGGALLWARGKREAAVLRNVAEDIDPELLLTDMNAALGLAQVKELQRSLERRKELFNLFSQAIARSPHKLATRGDELSYSGFPVFVNGNVKETVEYAKKKDVGTKPAFERSLVSSGEEAGNAWPNAYSVSMRCVAFPLHPRIDGASAQKLVKVLASLP